MGTHARRRQFTPDELGAKTSLFCRQGHHRSRRNLMENIAG
jgi:hypothetical protein